jgi:type IV pilus assembly protein PilA
VAIIAILAAIAIPQYQGYVARSQVSRVMSEAGSLKVAIEDCLASNDLTVATCKNAAITSDLATITPVIADAATITAALGNKAATALSGKNVKWTRDASSGAWVCSSTADAKYVPANCK